MKKTLACWLCFLLLLAFSTAACASGLTIIDSADLLEETSQFPFLAETDELAVNVRKGTSTKSEKVGRLERGTQVTVNAAIVSEKGELWYAVTLSDGTEGFVRGDLLVEAEEMAVVRAAYQAPAEAEEREYIGNRKSRKFHYPSCRTLPKESNRIYFSSRDEAVNQGFDPCGNCDP